MTFGEIVDARELSLLAIRAATDLDRLERDTTRPFPETALWFIDRYREVIGTFPPGGEGVVDNRCLKNSALETHGYLIDRLPVGPFETPEDVERQDGLSFGALRDHLAAESA